MRMLLSFQRPSSLSGGVLVGGDRSDPRPRAPCGPTKKYSAIRRPRRLRRTRRRRKRRLPTFRTCPSARSRGDIVLARARAASSSSDTPPCSIRRRASEREMPNALGHHARAGGPSPLVARRRTASSISSGASCSTNTRSKCALGRRGLARGSAATPPAPARAARLASRARSQSPPASAGELAVQQQPVVVAHRLVGDAQRLAVHLLAAGR